MYVSVSRFAGTITEICLCTADLAHVRTVLSDLRTQQKALSTELDQHFTSTDELNPLDGFATKMFSFSKQAKYRLDILSDIVTNAGGKYTEALAFYGEEQKSITSTSEFFGVFRTFVTSYKVRSVLCARCVSILTNCAE